MSNHDLRFLKHILFDDYKREQVNSGESELKALSPFCVYNPIVQLGSHSLSPNFGIENRNVWGVRRCAIIKTRIEFW